MERDNILNGAIIGEAGYTTKTEMYRYHADVCQWRLVDISEYVLLECMLLEKGVTSIPTIT